jgi:hypothetical protein
MGLSSAATFPPENWLNKIWQVGSSVQSLLLFLIRGWSGNRLS